MSPNPLSTNNNNDGASPAEVQQKKSENVLFKLIKQMKWKKARPFLLNVYGKQMAGEQDDHGNTPLHTAIGYRAPADFILDLIKANPYACQIRGPDDWLPLHVAAMWNSTTEVMEALIKEYPEALDRKTSKGRTPRHFSRGSNKELLNKTTEEWVNLTRVKRRKASPENDSE
mmetsp:Transcript_17275/g.24955  ORF Transcript_17275/g.24955 Transcript_17275/m.24955 type:complete len:172 (+) Transcript_17275:132-647(+)|eukprot:CAMPEP_0202465380 /NCGR_PEP_ID=MMETSP1360-20130828/65379_1 /ASSEMBLY_ACC=CAM_ASM_000848 /TAXON_ID=515479 /ORGANISM="Licmophora paradoxa, Strain CCMP2313" /LENGTH=171 /DNA_ID=CAMNT_0049089087 /DNA_START=34 /DNA_END=549 /DNA_ORIENTATION=+